MVEFQPSKLATWVRFPSPAPHDLLKNQCLSIGSFFIIILHLILFIIFSKDYK